MVKYFSGDTVISPCGYGYIMTALATNVLIHVYLATNVFGAHLILEAAMYIVQSISFLWSFKVGAHITVVVISKGYNLYCITYVSNNHVSCII